MSASDQSVSVPAFCSTQLHLLAEELASELAGTSGLLAGTSPAALQRAGFALTNLSINSQRTGLGGKTVLELGLDAAVGGKAKGSKGKAAAASGIVEGELPEHGLRVGDIVRVADQPAGSVKKKDLKDTSDSKGKDGEKQNGAKGVVTRVSRMTFSIALDREEDEVGNGRLWVVKLANDVTYKRMNWVMTKLQQMPEANYSTLIQVMFGLSSVSPVPKDLNDSEVTDGPVDWVDPSLNDSQKEAVKFALASKEIALIHGPPGTGKTHTLIELILQLLKRDLRVLVCGPSNISVDNIVERLSPHKIPIVRLGHPARLLPSVLNHSLDVLTQTSEAAAIVRDVRKEMDQKQASIRKTRNGKERRAIYGDLKELRLEFREREKKCVGNLVEGSKVVLATLHGAGGYQLRGKQFDVVIIDEASQALEAQCWVALIDAKKVVLAGDHLQLPPTIKSLNNKSATTSTIKPPADFIKGTTLERTLFDRLLALHGPSIKRMLTTQYRMHEAIMRFPSDALYEGKLIAGAGVGERLLCDLPYEVTDNDDTSVPVVFWDTQGGDFAEKADDEDENVRKSLLGESKSNEMEAALVKYQVKSLVGAGVKPEDIAVITPYNAQLSLLSHLLKDSYPGIELGSVDGFQGREKEAVILSLVRSNSEHEVGFLGERRRLNVAMTRPKRFLAVIGDSETVSRGSKFLKQWMDFLEEHADLRYPDLAVLNSGNNSTA